MTLHLAATPESSFSPYGYLPAPEDPPIVAPIKAGKGKNSDLYQSVTDSIISQLEAGRVPWVQPWGRPETTSPLGMPTNADTGNQYSGINILLLWAAAIDTCRTTQTWLTYKQAQKLGAQVRKGETGTTVCMLTASFQKMKNYAHKSRAMTQSLLDF